MTIGFDLRLVQVSEDLASITTVGHEDEPESGGMTRDAVERIWAAAIDLYRSGVHPAVQVCVRRDGAVMINRSIGHARGNGPGESAETEKVLATPDTPFSVYSASKAVTAFVIHMLHERGVLDIAKPVCEYFPEYARHGKGDISIAHVLAHRAGVPEFSRHAWPDRTTNHDVVISALCDAKPVAKAGRHLSYHVVSGGYILGEVVRRTTGRDLRSVLATEILDPLGFRFTNYGIPAVDVPRVAVNYLTGPQTPLTWPLERTLGGRFRDFVALSNTERGLTALIPSGNVVTTAHELSRFYEIFRRGGELDGVRVMAPETVRLAMTDQARLELDRTIGVPARWSHGLMLGSKVLNLFGRDTQHAFGHLGFTQILSWADPERALSCAVITSGKPAFGPGLRRWFKLTHRITSGAPKIRGAEMAVWDPLAGRP